MKIRKLWIICLCAGVMLLPKLSYAAKDPACVEKNRAIYDACISEAFKDLGEDTIVALAGCTIIVIFIKPARTIASECMITGMVFALVRNVVQGSVCGVQFADAIAACPEE